MAGSLVLHAIAIGIGWFWVPRLASTPSSQATDSIPIEWIELAPEPTPEAAIAPPQPSPEPNQIPGPSSPPTVSAPPPTAAAPGVSLPPEPSVQILPSPVVPPQPQPPQAPQPQAPQPQAPQPQAPQSQAPPISEPPEIAASPLPELPEVTQPASSSQATEGSPSNPAPDPSTLPQVAIAPQNLQPAQVEVRITDIAPASAADPTTLPVTVAPGQEEQEFTLDPTTSICRLNPQVEQALGQPVRLMVVLASEDRQTAHVDTQTVPLVLTSSGNTDYDELAKCLIQTWTGTFVPGADAGGVFLPAADVAIELEIERTDRPVVQ